MSDDVLLFAIVGVTNELVLKKKIALKDSRRVEGKAISTFRIGECNFSLYFAFFASFKVNPVTLSVFTICCNKPSFVMIF
jgi:hypothetical protein